MAARGPGGRRPGRGPSLRPATVLLRAETRLGRLVLGEGILATEVAAALRDLSARRAILVSEPGAWAAVGEGLARDLAAAGLPVEHVLLPQGEAAKRLSVIEDAASQLARLRVERREPIVAVGGGALGDAAGFLAATYLRGIPFVQVPTTLVAQIDSSIGGKTGVDLAEGKNLVGAFHQPAAIVIDLAVLATLDARQRRAALGEAVEDGGARRRAAVRDPGGAGAAIARATPGGRVGRAGGGRRARGVGEGRGRARRRARDGIGADRAEPRPHARPRDRGGRRDSAACSTARRSRMDCAPRRASARPAA